MISTLQTTDIPILARFREIEFIPLGNHCATGCSRMIHRFGEYLEPLTCISSGYSLVALGSKYGKIYVYQNIPTTNCVRITAILAHHSSVVHKIIFYKDQIISCSDDMTIGIVDILPDGALILSKILQVSKGKIFLKMKKKSSQNYFCFQGHVSRVKAIDIQQNRLLSGSDDRTIKLWSTAQSICFMIYRKITFKTHRYK